VEKEPLSTVERVSRVVGSLVLFVFYEFVLIPHLFKSRGEGFSVVQFLGAGIAGLVGAWLGSFFGRAFLNP
jgi:hypothetical protein